MDSAFRVSEVEICFKFNENPFKGKGDMERTRNARLEHFTFDCDLYLESALFSYGFLTGLTRVNI